MQRRCLQRTPPPASACCAGSHPGIRAAFSVPSTTSRLDASSHPRVASCAGAPAAAASRLRLRPNTLVRPGGRTGAWTAPRGCRLPGPPTTPLGWGAFPGLPQRLLCHPIVLRRRLQTPPRAGFQRRQRCMAMTCSRHRNSRSPRRQAVAWTAAASSASARSASVLRPGSGRPSSSSSRVGAEGSAPVVYQARSGRFVMLLVATCRQGGRSALSACRR
jgi:hypothetical protein